MDLDEGQPYHTVVPPVQVAGEPVDGEHQCPARSCDSRSRIAGADDSA